MQNTETKQANQTERDYAKEQAIAQVQSIQEMIAAYEMDWDQLEELQDEFDSFGGADKSAAEQGKTEYQSDIGMTWQDQGLNYAYDVGRALGELLNTAAGYTSQDEALDAIQEHPLSIEYRSGWATAGLDLTVEEVRIVLCTGGPHVEILGELDHNGSVDRVKVVYKDWGTSGEVFDFDRAAVMTYCELIGVGCF